MERDIEDIEGRTEELRGLRPELAEVWLCRVPAVNKALP